MKRKTYLRTILTIVFLTTTILGFGQIKIGEKIQGNFLGNGKNITATVIKIKEGKGNPVEDGTPDEYEIHFSDKKLKPIKADCCEIILINEGDLNKDRTEEISIYQAPMNGCTYSMTTYSYINGNWKKIVNTFMIPTDCEGISNEELQKIIFRENNNIYFLQKDMSNENGKLIKKKVKLN